MDTTQRPQGTVTNLLVLILSSDQQSRGRRFRLVSDKSQRTRRTLAHLRDLVVRQYHREFGNLRHGGRTQYLVSRLRSKPELGRRREFELYEPLFRTPFHQHLLETRVTRADHPDQSRKRIGSHLANRSCSFY